jgi:hypothetical protein
MSCRVTPGVIERYTPPTHIKDMSNLVSLRSSTPSTYLYFSWTIPSMVLHCLHETKYPVTLLGSFNSSASYPVAVISAPHFVHLAIILSNESKDIQYQSFPSEVLTNALTI